MWPPFLDGVTTSGSRKDSFLRGRSSGTHIAASVPPGCLSMSPWGRPMARHGLRCPIAADRHELHRHGTYDRLPIAHFSSDINVTTIINPSQLLTQHNNELTCSLLTQSRCQFLISQHKICVSYVLLILSLWIVSTAFFPLALSAQLDSNTSSASCNALGNYALHWTQSDVRRRDQTSWQHLPTRCVILFGRAIVNTPAVLRLRHFLVTCGCDTSYKQVIICADGWTLSFRINLGNAPQDTFIQKEVTRNIHITCFL